EDDAEGDRGERHRERRHDRRERGGERGPHHDQGEDEPDVVGLPHRADRVLDAGALAGSRLGAARHEVQEPGTEVGAAEEHVGGDPGPEEDEHGLGHGCQELATGPSRRSTYTVHAVSRVYTAMSTNRPMASPGAVFTASAVRSTR